MRRINSSYLHEPELMRPANAQTGTGYLRAVEQLCRIFEIVPMRPQSALWMSFMKDAAPRRFP